LKDLEEEKTLEIYNAGVHRLGATIFWPFATRNFGNTYLMQSWRLYDY